MKDESVLYLNKIAKILGNLQEDEINWESILEAFGFVHLLELEEHNRLIRSQHFGDEDYPWCITNVLKDAYEEDPEETKVMIRHILKNELIHQNDINLREESLKNYPGLKDFLYADMPLFDESYNVNSYKKSIKVFISYSSKDKLVAAGIKKTLTDYGIENFLAHNDIEVSQEWRERILKELHESDVFIPILSKNFCESAWCSQEAGIACYKNILVIPLSLDETIPYGFMNRYQGEKINPRYSRRIPSELFINPILKKFPEIEILDLLISRLENCRNFRNCEAAMNSLEPYFDQLDKEQIDQVIDISIRNNQIWNATRCFSYYLPKFIKMNKGRIDETKLNKLLKLIE